MAGGVHTRMHVYWGWHPLQWVYLHNWGVASTSAASTTGGCTFMAGGVHTRMHVYWGWHPLQVVYLHNWGWWHPPVLHQLQGGCTFITGGVHTRMHVYWGGIHYRWCTFITGGVASTSAATTTGGCTFMVWGVHTRMHVYWGWHPLQGGVHTRMHMYWGWHPLQGCTFITGVVASTSAASTTGGVPSWLGVCIPGCMCTGGGIHYRGVPS